MSPADGGATAVSTGGHRWSFALAVAVGTLGALAFLPVPFFILEIWLGGVLGGAAAGLLTVPICGALAWLASRRPAPSARDRPGAEAVLLAATLVHGGALAWASVRWDALMVSAVALPVAVWAWIWGVFGWRRAAQYMLPVFFGWFALPWEYFLRALDRPLQIVTTDIAHSGLNALGWKVLYWNELTIYSWDYYVIVNETCSGMNMLMTLSMYTIVFAWVTQPRLLNRVLLLLLTMPLALLANGLRVAIIYLLGVYGGDDLAMGFWHTGSAYIVFLPVFWFLYVVGNVLRRRFATKPTARPTATTPAHQSPNRV